MLPLLALHLTHPHGALAVVEDVGHWVIWLTFVVEVVVMLRVVRDRRAWIDGHRFELLVVAVSSRCSRSPSRWPRRCGCSSSPSSSRR